MTLTDPREELAEQSSFVGYLVGLAGLTRMVHELAADATGAGSFRGADDFVHALLGLASVGEAIERLAPPDTQAAAPAPPEPLATTRWLR